MKKFVLLSTLFAILLSQPLAVANPVGEFFKKVGRTLSNLGRNKSAEPARRSEPKSARKEDAPPAKASEKLPETRSKTVGPTSVPTSVDIRPAATAPPDPKGRRDVPYGVAVPNRPGLVTSPYAPTQGFVDVRGFPSSTEVLDPFTGKIFLTP